MCFFRVQDEKYLMREARKNLSLREQSVAVYTHTHTATPQCSATFRRTVAHPPTSHSTASRPGPTLKTAVFRIEDARYMSQDHDSRSSSTAQDHGSRPSFTAQQCDVLQGYAYLLRTS